MTEEEMNRKVTRIKYPESWMQVLNDKHRVKGNWETWNGLDSNIEKQLSLYYKRQNLGPLGRAF